MALQKVLMVEIRWLEEGEVMKITLSVKVRGSFSNDRSGAYVLLPIGIDHSRYL